MNAVQGFKQGANEEGGGGAFDVKKRVGANEQGGGPGGDEEGERAEGFGLFRYSPCLNKFYIKL